MAIVKMKHLVVVGIAGDEEAVTRRVQGLGVMHPEPVKPSGDEQSLADAERAVKELETVVSGLTGRVAGPVAGDAPATEEVLGLLDDERSAADQVKSLTRLLGEWKLWGDFSPGDVEALAAWDIHLKLWSGERKTFAGLQIPDNVCIEVVDRTSEVLFVTIAIGEEVSLDGFVEVGLPARDLREVRAEIGEMEAKLQSAQAALDEAAVSLPAFKERLDEAGSELAFQKTLAEGYADQDLFGIQGWVPDEDAGRVEKALKEMDEPLAVHLRDMGEDEEPPVLTRNGWLARALEPLLKILGVPEYKGMDPALFFAPCMLLFFGICLSDAGYGVILFAVATWARRKYGAKTPQIVGPMLICQLFGIVTTIWGLLTGGIFGIKFVNTGWILIDLTSDPLTLFYISVACGLVHLTIAYVLAMITADDLNSKLENLGKIAVLWGAVLGVLISKDVLHLGSLVWQGVLGFGVLLVLLWSSPSKNPLARVGLGLWNVYGLSSLLGDVMSYARLFGLGIATGAIAAVVNQLAFDAGAAVPVVGIVITVLIMIVGHGFNFAMGIIGAVVHPARLHAVEAFPKFVALTGTPYTPLK
ncbi:V-type ATP synthase subunit I [Thermodesulfobacteriota bacterium]